MRILLLEHPRKVSEAHFNDIANTPLWSCLMSGYAGAALVRAGFEAEIVDAVRLPVEETLRMLTRKPFPDLLAVHAVFFWEGTESLFRMLADLRGRGFDAPICLYGFFPGMVWKEILDYCAAVDFVVAGEPEQTLVELARNLGSGVGRARGIAGLASRVDGQAVSGGARAQIESVDDLPFPLRPSLQAEETVSVLASRGCYNNCSFCLVPTLHFGRSTWRARSPENIVSEISQLVSLGKRDFYFVDPNFIGPGKAGRERTLDLASRLSDLRIRFGMETRANDVTPELMRALVKAGLTRLLLGIESGRPDVLKRLGKHTTTASNEKAVAMVREAGIEPEIGFIMFDAESSLEDIRMNLDFLERNRLLDRLGRTANLLCHELIAFKGTPGYRNAFEKNLLVPQGLFGFEGRLLYRDPRVGWLSSAAKSVCLSILREMGRPFSPIHWAGDGEPPGEPYRAANNLLVDIFGRLLGFAEKLNSFPDACGSEKLLSKVLEELESAYRQPAKPDLSFASSRLRVKKPSESLPRLKGCFPFRIATTSYILPDEILPNVKFLGHYFDEIELVLFESGSESNLPAPDDVREMARIASDMEFSYNVHLPSDLFFGDPDRALRQKFCETALSFYERTLPLAPTCYVLHLDSRKADGTIETDISAWAERVSESLGILQSKGMELERVSVENLEYPLQRIQPFVKEFGLSFCLDLGHLIRYGHDIAEQTALFSERIAMAHLHGVNNGKDHTALCHIPDAQWETICRFLSGYRGGLSLEVFSLDDLAVSCARMVEMVR
ncbi:MAG: cobamide remodeling phosphodiesterase CbiR [Syntrophobacteraceae bacterium]